MIDVTVSLGSVLIIGWVSFTLGWMLGAFWPGGPRDND
jgi:hypothetical protein